MIFSKPLLKKEMINLIGAEIPTVVSPFSKKITSATLIRSCKKYGKLPAVNADFVILFGDENKPLFITASQYKFIMKSKDKTKAIHSVITSILTDALKKTVGGREWLSEYEYLTGKFFRNSSSRGVMPLAAGAE